jgi:hypothetical protein
MRKSHDIRGCVSDDTINMYWIEKCLLILDYLQIYGVLWNMAQTWPLPYVWLKWTRWTLWTNADYFSTTPDGAILGRSQTNINKWGEMDGYLEYTIPFFTVPAILLLISCALLLSSSRAKLFIKIKDKTLFVIFSALRVIYVPSSLAIARLYYCESDNTLSADPNEICWTGWHLIYSCVGFFCVFPLFVGLPIVLRRYVDDCTVYRAEPDHEKRLQAWEISFVFKLDSYWERSQLWITSSFRRSGAYTGVYILWLKAFCVLLFLLFRFNKMAQATLFWLACSTSFLYVLYIFPYRVPSSNWIACTLYALLLVNSSFGMFDSYGVQNSIMVAGNQTLWLLTFNCCGVALVLGICAVALLCRPLWPSQKALRRVLSSASWPSVVKWVECIREGYAMDTDCHLCPRECVDIMSLEERIRQLRHCWTEASAVGSIFSLLLSDAVEQLVITHTALAPTALRRHEHWDKAWLRGGDRAFLRRHHAYRLMPAQKRRIVLKLLALKAFIGDRVIRRSEEVDSVDEFGMPSDMRRRLTAMLLGEEAAQAEAVQRRGNVHSPREDAAAAEARERRWVSSEGFRRIQLVVSELASRTESLLKTYRASQSESNGPEMNALPTEGDDETEEAEKRPVLSLHSEDMAALFEEWNNLIYRFEQRDLDGGSFFSDTEAEEWFTYRHLCSSTYEDMRALERAEGGHESSDEEASASVYSFLGAGSLGEDVAADEEQGEGSFGWDSSAPGGEMV